MLGYHAEGSMQYALFWAASRPRFVSYSTAYRLTSERVVSRIFAQPTMKLFPNRAPLKVTMDVRKILLAQTLHQFLHRLALWRDLERPLDRAAHRSATG